MSRDFIDRTRRTERERFFAILDAFRIKKDDFDQDRSRYVMTETLGLRESVEQAVEALFERSGAVSMRIEATMAGFPDDEVVIILYKLVEEGSQRKKTVERLAPESGFYKLQITEPGEGDQVQFYLNFLRPFQRPKGKEDKEEE